MSGLPVDAGAVVLLGAGRDPDVFWAERGAGNVFLAGYHAFIGGKAETGDRDVPVHGRMAGAGDAEAVPRLLAVAAVRELFEETGVLVAASDVALDPEVLALARADLGRGRAFAAVLRDLGARLDLGLLAPAGRWVTPAFAARRFDTHFFLARLPEGQSPQLIAGGELAAGGFLHPGKAIAAWASAEALVPPPVLHVLRALAAGQDPGLGERLLGTAGATGKSVARIEFVRGVVMVPLRTETLPPATTTNAYVVGRARAVVVDPAAADPGEQERLLAVLDELAAEGVEAVAVLLTHHHPDHVGGVEHLRRRRGLPVWAHRSTADALAGRIAVDRALVDGETLDLGDDFALDVLHTPGHAPGHLCFYERRTRALLSGDNVVGHGTVLIDPPEGDMDLYLASLARLQGIQARALFGGHGPAIAHPRAAIAASIAHRAWREGEVLAALAGGPLDLAVIAAAAYPDALGAAGALAERQTLAHLERLARAGRVRRDGGRFALA